MQAWSDSGTRPGACIFSGTEYTEPRLGQKQSLSVFSPYQFLNFNVNLLILRNQLNANLGVRALAKPMARVFILTRTTTLQNKVDL